MLMLAPRFVFAGSHLIAAASLQAQPQPQDIREADQRTILARSNELMIAMDRQDRAGLERLTAPGFALRPLGGDPRQVTSRKEWIDNAMARRWRHNGYENASVVVDGDRAVMISTLNFAPPASGLKPKVNTASPLIDLWERRDGEWKATGRYAGRWTVFQWFDRIMGFAVGAVLFVGLGWAAGRRKRWAR
jgi:hypothetical protein